MSSSPSTGLQNASSIERHRRAGKINAAHFLRTMMATVPYKNHTILTDNGIQFTHRQRNHFAFEHLFERRCKDHGMEYRLSKVPPHEPMARSSI